MCLTIGAIMNYNHLNSELRSFCEAYIQLKQRQKSGSKLIELSNDKRSSKSKLILFILRKIILIIQLQLEIIVETYLLRVISIHVYMSR